ncbi:hypothetical protein CBR_g57053 [Chara braunii]|uniref:BED-type domain-containing protein n=1 Tax=Chara braunii TaxID=69332 RepID=A0A388K814_CHABU|nr:hypothetical protein CBR_g57053 [Chara braunii]|eukprot:GBG66171.1 hypothetical protein CBR_g57053 [Chara braunii]
MASSSRRRGDYPPFEALHDTKQQDLQRNHPVWRWVAKGQEYGLAGGGNFLMRCRLCDEVFPGSRSRAVDHFTKVKLHCPRRTGEILWNLQCSGALLKDPTTQRLAAEHAQRLDGELSVQDMHGGEGPDPSTAQTHHVVAGGGTCADSAGGKVEPHQGPAQSVAVEAAGATRTPQGASSSMQVAVRQVRQGRLDPWLGNKVQRDLDRLLALAMYRGDVSFNWLRLKETKDY